MQEIHRDASSAVAETALGIPEVVGLAIEAHELDEGRDNHTPWGPYHTQLWSFTRSVKSHYPEGTDPHCVFFEIEDEIEQRGGWAILDTDLTDEELYFEFVCNWNAVRFRDGETPLGNAVAMADTHPLMPARASKSKDRLIGYARFISIAGWLQVAMGNCEILLPVDTLAPILGVSAMTVTRYRQTAIRDGYLKVVQEHSHPKRRATEFLFDVTRFSVLHEKAQLGTGASFEAGTPLILRTADLRARPDPRPDGSPG